jgi:hypothetical protein
VRKTCYRTRPLKPRSVVSRHLGDISMALRDMLKSLKQWRRENYGSITNWAIEELCAQLRTLRQRDWQELKTLKLSSRRWTNWTSTSAVKICYGCNISSQVTWISSSSIERRSGERGKKKNKKLNGDQGWTRNGGDDAPAGYWVFWKLSYKDKEMRLCYGGHSGMCRRQYGYELCKEFSTEKTSDTLF